jgi:uncharacterized membrane protein
MQQLNNTVNFEPGTGRALSYGWERMKANALLFFLVALVAVVVELPNKGNSQEFEGDSITAIWSLLYFAYTLLFAPVINYGVDLIFLQGVRGDKVVINRLFDGFNNYVNVILANLLVFGLVIIGIVVFIVPGIYIGCRLAFTSYLVMDEGMDPVAAVEASWRLTKGHAWKIFLLGFLSILIFIAGLLLLVIGVLPAIMWIKSSFAAMYLSISQSIPPAQLEDEAEETL